MSRTQALVLAGHGSQRHPDSSAPLFAHADRIRALGVFDEVRTAFWKEEPTLRGVRHVVESDVAFAVPVLTSEGYFADEVFPRELGTGDDAATHPPDGPELHYAEPVGTHASMADVLADRVEGAIEGPLETVGVAVVGHGTERNARSAAATERHAETLRGRGRYAEVAALFLDEAPFVADVTDHLDADELVVVPFFVADGYHASRDVPDAMGHPGIGETATIDGRTVHYTGAVGTEPSLAGVVVERAVEAGASLRSGSAPRADPSAAEAAFAGWVDAASVARSWGELRIRSTPAGYELRHRDDAGADVDALDRLDDPVALREHVRHDDAGRYRPLSGARTLPTGWALTVADEVGLAHALRAVYPAAVEHWHRERTDRSTPTGFRGTVERQTGLYADLDDLDGNELSAATDAVCGSCVRSRRWAADAEAPSAVENDDGDVPCREACPFFLTAAHAFDESGGEAADESDPSVPVYALSAPANEYRVRYAEALAEHRDAEGTTLATDGGGR